METESYIGKYVCYGNTNGMFCWGKIESEIVINTAKGLREAFVLVDRMTGPHNGQISRQKGRTTVRKELLNLERDIFTKKMGMEDLTDDQLFLFVLSGDMENVHLGLMNMLRSESSKEKLEKVAKDELESRMGNKQE